MGVNPGHPPRPASAPAARPRRPQSAPANRPSAAPLERAPRRSHAHRRRAPQPREPHASPERQRQEIGELKVKVNDLTSQLLSARARAARLDGQVVAQAKQIETLLASRGRADRGAASPEGARRAPETVAVRTVRSQHERSMIVRRLREQLDRLREDLADRDDEVARLARSQPVWKPNLQFDFNVSVFDGFDARLSAVLRELHESNRFVQKSAESTSI